MACCRNGKVPAEGYALLRCPFPALAARLRRGLCPAASDVKSTHPAPAPCAPQGCRGCQPVARPGRRTATWNFWNRVQAGGVATSPCDPILERERVCRLAYCPAAYAIAIRTPGSGTAAAQRTGLRGGVRGRCARQAAPAADAPAAVQRGPAMVQLGPAAQRNQGPDRAGYRPACRGWGWGAECEKDSPIQLTPACATAPDTLMSTRRARPPCARLAPQEGAGRRRVVAVAVRGRCPGGARGLHRPPSELRAKQPGHLFFPQQQRNGAAWRAPLLESWN